MELACSAVATPNNNPHLPFGGYRTTPTTNPVTTDQGFTGHKHNDYIKMIYMGARWFLPGLGRFASADSIVPYPTNPQSFNRYSYVQNSPLNRIDPTGHEDICDNPLECSNPPPTTQPPEPPIGLPLGYQWVLLTPEGDGAISFYTIESVDNSNASTPDDLSNELHYRFQGTVILNGQIWNYIYDKETKEGYWQKNTWGASGCNPPYASATQCVVPLDTSSTQLVTGAVSGSGRIPRDQDQLVYIQVEGGEYPFGGDGLLVNVRDACPACSPTQIDILTLELYKTYNLSSNTTEVYIWAAVYFKIGPLYEDIFD